MKTLGGTLMVRNAIQYDYCVEEAINCLKEFCDEIVVVNVGSDDGTAELLWNLVDVKTTVIELSKKEWDDFKGREKLAHFTNVAIGCLSTDYNINLQADEIISEKSFLAIREAINTAGEAFYVTRKNLWKDCYHELNVPHERKPCSTEIIRLAKTNYKSVGDGESLEAPASTEFMKEIVIWHYGFVRKKEVMIAKIKNMQTNVFEIDYDKKMDGMEVFDWSAWFSEEDLKLITEPHPIFIKEWVKNRP